MTENTSHDEDLILEEADTEAVTGGASNPGRWEPMACTTEGTEFRNTATGKIKLVRNAAER